MNTGLETEMSALKAVFQLANILANVVASSTIFKQPNQIIGDRRRIAI